MSVAEPLPRQVVEAFIRPFFNRADALTTLGQEFGTPLYVVEPQVLKDRAHRFISAFQNHLPDIKAYYAMKSNNLPFIAGQMVQNGFGLDVSSGEELSTALRLGAEDIIFSGPGKTPEELALAATHAGRVTLLLDSPGEFDRLTRILGATGEACRSVLGLGIRINSHPEGLWRKFGVLPCDVPDLLDRISRVPSVRFKGFQCHASWNMEPSRQVDCVKTLGRLLEGLTPDQLSLVEFLDLGGGYWPAQGEWLVTEDPLVHTWNRAEPIERFAEEISRAVKKWIFPVRECRVCFEPGRWICNDAMHILIKAVDRKADDLVITDAGTNTVGWERFETDYFPVLNLTRPAMEEKAFSILGALCTPHDVWGQAVYGEDVKENDLLLIPTQGAYTYSLRQRFIKPLPRVTALVDGEGRLLSKEETG